MPITSADYGTGATTAFNNSFQNVSGLLNNYFGMNPATTATMATGQIPSIFGSNYTSYANGFNNGFGSGFPGLGTAADRRQQLLQQRLQ